MKNKANWLYRTVMRIIDLIISITVIVIFSWLLLLIAIWIKLESKGPAIFRQERIGLNAKTFTCYKFRTMYIDTQDLASHMVSASQITKCGQFLRKTKLDELPQVWNILFNEMAFVGPRPCLESQKQLIKERNQRNILTIKPGITGWSQINGIDMSDPVILAQSDAVYLSHRSILFDIKIMILTFLGKGMGDRVKLKNLN